MRPAHKTISAGRLDGSRAGLFYNSKPLFSEEHPNLALRLQPLRRSQILIRSFFSIPKRGKVNLYMATKLYVGNLAFQTTSEELQSLFAQAGTVESASVVEDRMTGRSRGFAFVEMATKEEAAAAIVCSGRHG